MISKKIVISMLLCIATHSLYGMLSYPSVFFTSRQSLLFRALYSYDAEKVKKLIMDGADINEKDSWDTPFLWQVIDSRKRFSEKEVCEIIDLLIEKGVNLDFTVGRNRATILHQTAAYGEVSLLAKFIKAGANVNVKNKYGQTACERAKREEIKTMLRSTMPTISPVLKSQQQKHNKKMYEGLHVVLRCSPGQVKQLEDKK